LYSEPTPINARAISASQSSFTALIFELLDARPPQHDKLKGERLD
jgi:hypothetical protein